MFYSSHILKQVEAIADRIGIMDGGQLVALNTIEELRAGLDTGTRITLNVADELNQKLNGLPHVRDIEVADERVRGVCFEPEAKLEFIDRVREVTTVTDIHIEESSMEDMFASYTTGDTDDGPNQLAVGEVAQS